jgi:hypothetical protein
MKAIIVLLFAAILTTGCAGVRGPQASANAQAQAAKDEADLAAALSGRTAGLPQDCVNEHDLGDNRTYGRSIILFSGRTDEVVYVNRLPVGCPGLDFGRALKTRTTTSQLCRGDVVTVLDPASGAEYGSCSLGEFTPYRRTR